MELTSGRREVGIRWRQDSTLAKLELTHTSCCRTECFVLSTHSNWRRDGGPKEGQHDREWLRRSGLGRFSITRQAGGALKFRQQIEEQQHRPERRRGSEETSADRSYRLPAESSGWLPINRPFDFPGAVADSSRGVSLGAGERDDSAAPSECTLCGITPATHLAAFESQPKEVRTLWETTADKRAYTEPNLMRIRLASFEAPRSCVAAERALSRAVEACPAGFSITS